MSASAEVLRQVTGIKKVTTQIPCQKSRSEQDFIIEKRFNISKKFEITTYLCSDTDTKWGMFYPDGPPKDWIISTREILPESNCDHSFANSKKNSSQILKINNFKQKKNYVICGNIENAYFLVNPDPFNIKDDRFLKVFFDDGSFTDTRIFLVNNLKHEPIKLTTHRRGEYYLTAKGRKRKLKPKKEINLSPIIESHFGLTIKNKYIPYIPFR